MRVLGLDSGLFAPFIVPTDRRRQDHARRFDARSVRSYLGKNFLVDGRDLHDDVAAWQRNIGYVRQDVYLMDDNIRRNVAFGLPD